MDFANRPIGAQHSDANAESIRDVAWLQQQLQRSESRLHEAWSDVVATNAELRASVREQQTLNEELRTANEELAASEGALQTLNTELEWRVGQLAQANSDMNSMVAGTRIAIMFLDEELRIRSYTPAVTDVLRLRDGDRGRPITDMRLLIAYPGLAADARQVLQTHGATERQAAHEEGGADYLVRLLPYRIGDRVAGVVVTFLDITATVAAEQALRASDERFRRMAAAVPALLFIAEADMRWSYVNPPFYALTGQTPDAALGPCWTASLHPDDLQPTQRSWTEAGGGAATLEHEARLRRVDGSWCWYLLRAVPQLDGAGRVVRWYGSCTDIDDRRRAEKRQGLQLAEAQHRIQDILAVTRSILSRTLERGGDLDHLASHLAGRIGALSRTQCVAARTADGFVMLEDIVHEEFAAHGGGDDRQLAVMGPPVRLSTRMAGMIGLAVHELATNSFKYGALAVPSGRVVASWHWLGQPGTPGGPRLAFEWRESGVPLTDLRPMHWGFGRELIEQGLPLEIGADTDMEFRPGGLCCAITFNPAGLAAVQEGTAA